MAIIDDIYEIRQQLHKIKCDEAEAATGTELDSLGREYSVGRASGEIDADYKHRIWMRIIKVMTDEAATEIERKREKAGESDNDLVVFLDTEYWGFGTPAR